MFVDQDNLARGTRPDALLGFFYTQRTGSRALTRWLASVFETSQIYFYRYVDPFVHWRALDAATIADFPVFAGFSDYFRIDLGKRPLAAFAAVRHPIYRLASLYEMSRSDKHHVYHALATGGSFEQYYREGSAERPYYFQNLCARRIGGAPNFSAARDAMESVFGAVATTGELEEFTRLLASTYGWTAEPMPPPERSDADKYAAYLDSPLAGEILDANREDLALYEFVAGGGAAAATATSGVRSPGAPRAHPPCPICGDPMVSLKAPDYCPGCGMPPRIRSLPELMESVIAPWVAEHGRTDLPLLAFAATRAEQRALRRTFAHIRSVSLYGDYGDVHEPGVDARDLGRYPDASFAGAMSILLFDYFPEHEAALAELYRVLAPGSVLFTLILTSRVLEDDSAPRVTKRIEPKPGYFEYVPEGGELLSVSVGRAWLTGAMTRAGFDAHAVRLRDPATDQTLEWFIGFKPAPDDGAARAGARAYIAAAEAPAGSADAAARRARGHAVAIPPAVANDGWTTLGHRREYLREVDPGFGFARIRLTLTIPSVSQEARSADFGEHVAGARTVIGLLPGKVLLSEDLGASWRVIVLPGAHGVDFAMCFTTASGHHLLQTNAREASEAVTAVRPQLYRYTPDWKLAGIIKAGDYNWHGRAAIGEAGGVIMWAEYPDNKVKYLKGREHEALTARVWRSRDDGCSWEAVFEQPGDRIRHFHTVVPDPFVPGQWWLSSGDRAHESRVWVSRDNGDSWVDVTNEAPAVALHPSQQSMTQAVQRYTDIVIGEELLIWGSDDWLGPPALIEDPAAPPGRRSGARMFCSPRTDPLQPRNLGWIGNPVRSIIDIGPALLVTTEAKRAVLTEPQVCLVAKDASGLVQQLFTIDVADGGPSGFTFSRASACAEDGHFFSYRGYSDLGNHPIRMLHWHVAFE